MSFNDQDRQCVVTLSAAKGLWRWAERSFAALRMTGPVLIVKSHYEDTRKGTSCMSTEENKAIVRRYLEEAWNKGNVGIIDELMVVDYARYVAGSATPLSREGQKQRIAAFHKAFPDLHLAVEDLVAEGDQV